MSLRARPALVGRRFLSVTAPRGSAPAKVKSVMDWDWRGGWVRSSTSGDPSDPELQVRHVWEQSTVNTTHQPPSTSCSSSNSLTQILAIIPVLLQSRFSTFRTKRIANKNNMKCPGREIPATAEYLHSVNKREYQILPQCAKSFRLQYSSDTENRLQTATSLLVSWPNYNCSYHLKRSLFFKTATRELVVEGMGSNPTP